MRVWRSLIRADGPAAARKLVAFGREHRPGPGRLIGNGGLEFSYPDHLISIANPWQPTPVLLPGKSHGWRSPVSYSPWGSRELDTTERLHPGRDLPCSSEGKESACNAGDLGSIPGSGRSSGEGNGNPLQYSCLENPMVRGA